jgi:spermidine/putrescine transport system permease protein
MSEKVLKDNKTEQKMRRKFTFTRKWFASPYVVFLAVFVLFPMLLLVYRAFTDGDAFRLTFDNFSRFFSNWDYIRTFLESVLVAVISTILCLLIGYPVAYILTRLKTFKNSYAFVLLFILPMWVNFLLRIMAIKEILPALNIPLGWGAIVIGMVYDFLPFMIFPLYNALNKMDGSLLEAASDLGANKTQVFFKTVVPLSMPGIMSGITMVFVPVMSAFAVSDAMSGNKIKLFCTIIENLKSDVNYAAALAIIMSVFIVISLLISSRYERIGDADGGTMI